MGCNCGAKKVAPKSYVHTAKDGTVTAFKSETEAKAAVARKGGSYKVQEIDTTVPLRLGCGLSRTLSVP